MTMKTKIGTIESRHFVETHDGHPAIGKTASNLKYLALIQPVEVAGLCRTSTPDTDNL